jgi:tRNA dimethylallyltransferase
VNKVLVILGPTATGKTDLALNLAKKFNGELVACDSRQVYTGLDLGTGKMPGNGQWKVRKERMRWEVSGINIWMYDVVSSKRQYTVAEYVKEAKLVIDDIHKRTKLPIIVGGTGLYLKALLEGIPALEIPIDKNLRRQLQKLTLVELQQKLQDLSIKKWNSMNNSDRQNPRRLLRAIELISMNPYSITSKQSLRYQRYLNKRQVTSNKLDILKVGLTAPREELYKKVDLRVLTRLDQGMLEEAEGLKNEGLSLKRMKELGLEYGVMADYLEAKINKEELIKLMQFKIHGYVKRQLTWFKKEKDINWFDITAQNHENKIEKLVDRWYDS